MTTPGTSRMMSRNEPFDQPGSAEVSDDMVTAQLKSSDHIQNQGMGNQDPFGSQHRLQNVVI